MTSRGRTLRTAAMLSIIGLCAPLALTPLFGMTVGIGFGWFVFLLISWFVQGLIFFSLPLMLLARLPALQGAVPLAAAGVGLILAIGALLYLYNRGSGVQLSFSVSGLLLFGLGGAAAGLYLHQLRVRAPRI